MLLLAVLVRAAWQSGLNPDQMVDQQYFTNNLANIIGPERFGQYVFGPGSAAVEASYGYTFQALAFGVSWGWATLTGAEFDPTSVGVLGTRNVLVLLVGLTVLPSVYLISRSLSARRWVGWLAIAGVALLPTFTGHGLINQKDMPLAAGLTALTAAAVVFLRRLLAPGTRGGGSRRTLLSLDRTQWALAGMVAFGVSMTLGTRPPSAVVVVATVTSTAAIAFVQRRNLTRAEATWPLLGLVAGGLVVLATNAAATPNPVGWVLDSISLASDFPAWRGQQLVNGSYLLPEDLPRTHIIGMVLAQTPAVMILLSLIGVLGIVRDIATPGPVRRSTLLWLPVAIQLGLLPLAGVVQGSLFYNNSRQVLFVYPMIAVLASWGVFMLASWLPSGRPRIVAFAVVGILAALPVVDTLTLYPYQYVYFNEFTRGDLTNRYDLDYWGISGRETQEWVNEAFPTAAQQYPTGWEFKRYATPGISFVEAWPDNSDRPLIWAGNWYPAWRAPDFPECPIVHEVTRNLWGDELRLGYVRRCDTPP